MSSVLVFAVIAALAATTQSCNLPSSATELSWMVSIHNNETKKIFCLGQIITKSFVISLIDCFFESHYVYLKGTDVYATSGWEDGVCVQVRHGKKVMGHPEYRNDQHRFSFAILETQDFDLDPANPPAMPLPSSEAENVATLADIIKHHNSCQIVTLSRGLTLKEFYIRMQLSEQRLLRKEVNYTPAKIDYGIYRKNFTLITRESCWADHYCRSGNWGCMPFFQASRSFVCSTLDKDESCRDDWVSAPVVCGDKIVGVLKECLKPKLLPLMISGINDDLLRAIELYKNISKSDQGEQLDNTQRDDFPIKELLKDRPLALPRS